MPGLNLMKYSKVTNSLNGNDGCRPWCCSGGWSQYVVTQIGGKGRIIACDLLPMDPIVGVDFLQGDFRDELVMKALLERVGDSKVQLSCPIWHQT